MGEAEAAHVSQRAVLVLDQKPDELETRFGMPYRSDYYGVGICLAGHAIVTADLEEHRLVPGSVLAMPPQTIKQWRNMSRDFKHVVVFFTRAYLTDQNLVDPDRFNFFEPGNHAFALAPAAARSVFAALRQIRQHYRTPHPHQNEILKPLITALLFELQGLCPREPATYALGMRGRQLTARFKHMVKADRGAVRNVGHYAEALAVTPRHLSEVVKVHTGRTAGEWIQQTLALEARVLLLDPGLSVAQIAEALGFPDQSSFGRFFRNLTGQSPLHYRKKRPANPTF